jgi:hypothetical protein
MPDKVKLDLQERLHKVKDRFDSQHKWTDIDENIKLLKDFQAEMKIYIEDENRSVDKLMMYYIREDDKQLYDERMQEFLFSRIFHVNMPYIKVLNPKYAIPGVKQLERPEYPSIGKYMPTVEEAEQMLADEEAIKKNKKHSSSDNQ